MFTNVIVAHQAARKARSERYARQRAKFNTETREIAMRALRAYFSDEEARTDRCLAIIEQAMEECASQRGAFNG